MVTLKFQIVKFPSSQKFSDIFADVDKAGEEWAKEVMEVARVYPPPSGSNYERTNTLYNSWRTDKGHRRNLWWWRVGTTAISHKGRRYSTYVVGVHQPGYHAATGWIKLRDRKVWMQSLFTKKMQEAINKRVGT